MGPCFTLWEVAVLDPSAGRVIHSQGVALALLTSVGRAPTRLSVLRNSINLHIKLIESPVRTLRGSPGTTPDLKLSGKVRGARAA